MTQQEFNLLSSDLRDLAIKIPLRWGAIQNNRTDDNINMVAIHSYAQLEREINFFLKKSKKRLDKQGNFCYNDVVG